MKLLVSDRTSAHLLGAPQSQVWDSAAPANSNHPAGGPGNVAFLPVPATHTGNASHAWYRRGGKRALDVLFVLATLPVSLPIIALSAIALWLEDGHPFYRQDRLGKDGKRFSILKLRTMVRDADAQFARLLESDPALRKEWETTQKLKCDPRITRVGRILRVTSLDELPQLWNVLIGEMSLVGPRPMMPEQLPLYGDAAAYFALQPGITGPWQVSTRNENSFSCRADLDADYCRDISLPRDLGLLLRTVNVVLRRTGY